MTATLDAPRSEITVDPPTTTSDAVPPRRSRFGRIGDDLRAPARWPALDGVRGLAVLSILAWHAFRLAARRHGIDARHAPVVVWPLGTARFGVDAFFVLSGLLVVHSWKSARARASNTFRACTDFFGRRAARILPAYWLMLVILIPLVAPILWHQPRRLAAFITLNQYLKWWLPPRVNEVSWSVTTEWNFYLLVPLVALFLRWFGRWPVLIGCFALSLWWWFHTPYDLPSSFVFGRLDQFVLGAIIGELLVAYEQGRPSRIVRAVNARGMGVALLVALLALGTYHGSTMGLHNVPAIDVVVHPLVGIVFAMGILRLVTGPPKPVMTHPFVRFAALISFGLYLWHYPILQHGLTLANRGAPVPPVVRSATVAIVLCVVSIVVATLSYVCIERPFLTRKAASSRADGAREQGRSGSGSAAGREEARR